MEPTAITNRITIDTATPINKEQRIEAMDVLRGFALFGAGVMLLTSRLEAAGRSDVADIYLRRNMWLVLFGAPLLICNFNYFKKNQSLSPELWHKVQST
jgi:uncharacterized membrane protein YeiB